MKRNVIFMGVATVTIVLATTAILAIAQTPPLTRARARYAYLTPEALERRAREKEYGHQGYLALKAGNPRKAEEWFRKAIAVYEGRVFGLEARCGLADALLAQGQRTEAIALYQEALKILGMGSPEFLLRYGKVCEKANLPKEAAWAYRRAFAIQEYFPIALTGKESDAQMMRIAEASRGIYQQGRGDLKGAIATYKQILARDPNFTLVRKRLAQSLEETGQLKESQQERAILTR